MDFPPVDFTVKVTKGIPVSLTSLAALGGWLYLYVFSKSSVVMKPCSIIWLITILALLFVIDFICSKNSFVYFCFFPIKLQRVQFVRIYSWLQLLANQFLQPMMGIKKELRMCFRFCLKV